MMHFPSSILQYTKCCFGILWKFRKFLSTVIRKIAFYSNRFRPQRFIFNRGWPDSKAMSPLWLKQPQSVNLSNKCLKKCSAQSVLFSAVLSRHKQTFKICLAFAKLRKSSSFPFDSEEPFQSKCLTRLH